jgi:hypothetical protein
MVCSHCGGDRRGGAPNHNIRTCKLAHVDTIAENLVNGVAKGAILGMLGHVGALIALVNTGEAIYHAIAQDGTSKNAKKRQIIDGICAAAGA